MNAGLTFVLIVIGVLALVLVWCWFIDWMRRRDEQRTRDLINRAWERRFGKEL